MIYLEKNWKKRFLSLFLFLISGIWGLLCLNSKFISSDDVLFPSLTGMFGLSGLLMSLGDNVKIPKQRSSDEIRISGIVKIVATGLIAGLLMGVLPGAGESQAGVLVSSIAGIKENEFLGSLAGINVSNSIFALVSLYSIGKVRSGAAVVIDSIVQNFRIEHLLFCLGVVLFSAGISSVSCWFIGKKTLETLEKINYRKVSIGIIVFTVFTALLLTGFFGVFVLFISTCMGLLPILFDVKRTSNMGFLMVSTIIYFSGFTWVVNQILF